MSSTGRITWQAGLALVTALIINTIWEIRTVREDPDDTKSSEPKIEVQRTSKRWLKSIINLLFGIILLTIGSNFLVKGASSAALILGVSEAVIGLTIVAAGTSMPELITSLVAALRGRTDLAIGNVVGSSLLNQLLVLGGTAIFSGEKGLEVETLLIQKDMPLMIITTLACLPIFWSNGRISRQEGGILVLLYMAYLIDQVLPRTLPTLQEEFRLVILCFALPVMMIVICYQTMRYWIKVKQAK